MVSYIFGGDTGETADSIRRKRRMVEALLKGRRRRVPQNVGEGIASIGEAIAGRVMQSRLDRQETAGREAFGKTFSEYYGGGDDFSGAASSSVSEADVASSSSAASSSHESSNRTVKLTGGKQGFIDALMPGAIEASKRTGVDPRIIVAQAAQETGWGRSAPGNNFFGIKSHGKGGGQTFTTHEVINGKRVKIRDSFRRYKSPFESALGYAEFLKANKRYRPMMRAQGLDAQLVELGRSGYATDPNYSSSVGAIARSIPANYQPSAAAPQAAPPTPSMQDFGPQLSERQRNAMWPEQGYDLNTDEPAPPIGLNQYEGTASTEGMPGFQPFQVQSPAVPSAAPGVDPIATGSVNPVAQALMRNGSNVASSRLDGPGSLSDPGAVVQALMGIENSTRRSDSSIGVNSSPQSPVVQTLMGKNNPRQQHSTTAQLPDTSRRLAQVGVDPQLIQMLGDPYATPGQRFMIQETIKRQLEASKPMSPLEAINLERAKIALENDRNPKPETTDDIREYQLAKSQGFEGTFADYMQQIRKAGSASVTVNNAPSETPIPEYNKLPAGYVYKRDQNGQILLDENGVPTAVPITGGPAAIDAEKDQKANLSRRASEVEQGGLITQEIDRIHELMKSGTLPDTGVGEWLRHLPYTDARSIHNLLETIRANIGFNELQQMRDQSPTGGALGQVTVREIDLLQAMAGSLDQGDAQLLPDNLNRLWNLMQDTIHGPGNGPARRELSFKKEDQPSVNDGGSKRRTKSGIEYQIGK